MPIRPIDMQVLIPKSQNISKMSQDMANKSENIVQQSYNTNKKIEEKKLTKVNNIEKKEDTLIKANDKNKVLYGKDKKNVETNNSSGNTEFDIKI